MGVPSGEHWSSRGREKSPPMCRPEAAACAPTDRRQHLGTNPGGEESVLCFRDRALSPRKKTWPAQVGGSWGAGAVCGPYCAIDRAAARGRTRPALRETILGAREAFQKQRGPSVPIDQTTRCDRGNLSQRDLSRSPQGLYSRDGILGSEVMTDVVTTLLLVLSVSVFVAHAFDAYRAP